MFMSDTDQPDDASSFRSGGWLRFTNNNQTVTMAELECSRVDGIIAQAGCDGNKGCSWMKQPLVLNVVRVGEFRDDSRWEKSHD